MNRIFLPRVSLTASLARCRRRRRALAPVARDIFLWRGDGRALAPAAWAAACALLALLGQWADIGFFLVPSFMLLPALGLIALYDARYFVIPDGPVLFLGLCGFGTFLVGAPQEAATRLAAGAAGYASMRLVAFAYEALRGAPGVGEGDAKLYALAGIWLGFAGLPSSLIYAVFSALISAVVALRQGALENARQPIPFGPHLALGLWLVWVFGPLEAG
ncbi:A24 family peptidase [Methylocystis sp. JR02]|uniref:A24 family peptidase n=1 Tax=Methylocystis sp. JR02 TaxID=3046284 RepID=UPI0024B90634|nr:A24 family peptidase [Methylocystis sp. JR02]MDJ0447690.1 A24 family peptidase [Methylocystis sp. JR02]